MKTAMRMWIKQRNNNTNNMKWQQLQKKNMPPLIFISINNLLVRYLNTFFYPC